MEFSEKGLDSRQGFLKINMLGLDLAYFQNLKKKKTQVSLFLKPHFIAEVNGGS